MSFQAYLDTIRARTGRTPADFRAYAIWQGYLDGGRLKPEIKAGTIVEDLKRHFGLGHGHAVAIHALLKGAKTENAKDKSAG